MNVRCARALRAASLSCLLALAATCVSAQSTNFSFGVIGQVIKTPGDDTPLARAIAESDADNLAFIAADGFKRADEPCSDQLYQHRLDLLVGAKNGLILSLADGDWAECKTTDGRPAAMERLTRLRELFFVDEFSLGASKIPLIRHSNAAKFRSYAEDARWEIGNILFATINLPSNNNHFRIEAGRNSEFEDRLIANRAWLQHIFAVARLKKMNGIALICDGNPLLRPGAQRLFDGAAKHDGFAEIRQQLTALASKFSGHVLIIHNQAETRAAHAQAGGIAWHGNLGELGLNADWIKLTVKPGSTEVFVVDSRNPTLSANGGN